MKSYWIGVSFREKQRYEGYILELIAGFLNKCDEMYMDYKEMSIQWIIRSNAVYRIGMCREVFQSRDEDFRILDTVFFFDPKK